VISKYLGLRPKLKSSLKIEPKYTIAGTFKELGMMKRCSISKTIIR
jgi:hypothetical protein